MRLALLALLAGCPQNHDGMMCQRDSDCGGDVCARDNECLPASQIRMVKVTWQIRGMQADATNCAASPDFYLLFDGPTYGDQFGFEPVPCMAGQFTIDKLPDRFSYVEIGVDGGFDVSAPIDSSNTASFNLSP